MALLSRSRLGMEVEMTLCYLGIIKALDHVVELL